MTEAYAVELIVGGLGAVAFSATWYVIRQQSDRVKDAEARIVEQSRELSSVRERIAREYHSKEDLRELLQEMVAPINRAIASLQADISVILKQGWPGGGQQR